MNPDPFPSRPDLVCRQAAPEEFDLIQLCARELTERYGVSPWLGYSFEALKASAATRVVFVVTRQESIVATFTLTTEGGVVASHPAWADRTIGRFMGRSWRSIVSDEENGGDVGAKFLVEEHPELFAGVRYAIGEFGGFSLHMGGHYFYPNMVAGKQICQLGATMPGRAGHGSMPLRGQAMAKLGTMLRALDRHSLPVYLTPVTRAMLKGIASAWPGRPGGSRQRLSTIPRPSDYSS